MLLLILNGGTVLAKEYPAYKAELPNTNNKMSGSTVYVYDSERPEYYQYINGRYGFAVDFPKNFSVAFLSANSDGANFKLPDGSVVN